MFFRARSTDEARPQWRSELLRWAFLTGVAAWIFHPFATSRFYGTGDALWYSNMLADFVLQLRAGIFPVWVGQTEYAFNGAVYPLRVAPMYQHVGGALDLLTAHHLSFFELQHAIIITSGVGAILSCYLCLITLLPTHRWLAALLSTLYITCPGVLGLIFIQDLYMSWMTLPFLPLVLLGTVRSFRDDRIVTWLALGLGLGGAWLAHAPIAMWITLVAGLAQVVRLGAVNRRVVNYKRALFGAAIVLALTHYPFVSVSSLHVPGTPAVAGSLDHPERIVQVLRAAFPGCLKPLSNEAGEISDLQLGLGLAGLLVMSGAAWAINRELLPGFLIFVSVSVLLILLPIPRWTDFFWLKAVPNFVRVLTFYWPMHRLYTVLAITVVFTTSICIPTILARRPWLVRSVYITIAVACFWSLYESRKFQNAALRRLATTEDTSLKGQAENRLLMVHSYGLFAKLPPYFSNGVVDPQNEVRLLDTDGSTLTPRPVDPPIEQGVFTQKVGANPGVLELQPSITLLPGRRYNLEFLFSASRTYTGVLQLIGKNLYREYLLPSSGEKKAFGAVGTNSRLLALWTTMPVPESVTIRFIPSELSAEDRSNPQFARFRLFERIQHRVDNSAELRQFVPLVVETNCTRPSKLETPRMAIDGYHVTIDGNAAPVEVSQDGLITFDVPAGRSTSTLSFSPPLTVRLSYWSELTFLVLGGIILMYRALRHARFQSNTSSA